MYWFYKTNSREGSYKRWCFAQVKPGYPPRKPVRIQYTDSKKAFEVIVVKRNFEKKAFVFSEENFEVAALKGLVKAREWGWNITDVTCLPMTKEYK